MDNGSELNSNAPHIPTQKKPGASLTPGAGLIPGAGAFIVENIFNENEPGWNQKLEHAAKEIGEVSSGYKMMHIKVAQKASRTHTVVMFIGIFIGPIAGILSGIGAALDDSPTPPLLPIMSAIMSFLSGIIVTVIKFGKYDEVSTANKTAAARYTSLEGNVRRQLALYRGDRPPARKYLEWLNNSFDELFLAAPLVPSSVYSNYTKYAEKHGLIIPNQYETTISVNGEENNIKAVADRSLIHVNSESHPQIIILPDPTPPTLDTPSDTLTPTTRERIESYYVADVNLPTPDISSDNLTPPNRERIDSYYVANVNLPSPGKVTRVKRTNTFSQISELSKFSDGLMDYEIKRMMGY
jgi:hypothetical protein